MGGSFLLLLLGVLLLCALLVAAFAALTRAGRMAERADAAQATAEATRRRGEIMAQDRTIEDVAKRMSGRGDF